MTITQKIIYSIGTVNVGLFVFLAFLSIRTWKRSVRNRHYFGLLVSIITWLISANLLAFYPSSIVLGKLDFLSASGVAFFFALFACTYIVDRKRRNYFYTIAISLFFLLAIFSLANNASHYHDVSTAPQYAKIAYGIYIAIITFLTVGIGGVTLLYSWRKSIGIKKQQLGYFLFGFIIPAFLLFLLSAYNSLLVHVSDDLYSLFSDVGVVFALICSRSIFRYRFLDIGLTIQRSAVRFLSFVILFAFYLFAVLFAKQTYIPENSSNQLTFLVIVTLLVVLTMEPLRKLVFKIVDRFFGEYDERKQRNEKRLQILLSAREGWEGLVGAVENLLQDRLGVSSATFVDHSSSQAKLPNVIAYLRETGKILVPEEVPFRLEEDIRFVNMLHELENIDISMFIPVGVGSSFIGYFSLGSRKTKKPYTIQEVGEAKAIQLQFSEALFNARLYHQAVGRIGK